MMRIVVAALLALAQAFAYAQEPAPVGFAAVVGQYFDTWDRDRNGQLAYEEVERLLADLKTTGRSAAALAAIRSFQGDAVGQRRPVSRDFLMREATRDTALVVRPAFEPRYRDGLARIENSRRELFGPGAPARDGIRQGHIGDCYFVSVVGAVTQRDPALVRKWFQPQSDKTVRVSFPLGATSMVNPLTDGEIAMTSFAGQQGLWINTLEKAFGSIMRANFPASDFGISVDAIASGGNPVQTIRLMTAYEAYIEVIRSGDLTPAQVAEATGRVGKILADCQRKRKIAIAGTSARGLPPGIHPTHAYTILGFDKDVVTIWNPHGNQFTPASDPGLKSGYPTVNGRFTMPLRDFVNVFAFLAFESDIALRTNVDGDDPSNPNRKP
ncbi:MAG: hypothetical protein K1X57_10185 [Gemmataceae bacterium]|nr:hypothetical protein [Gemmataceae bacterium]